VLRPWRAASNRTTDLLAAADLMLFHWHWHWH